ncbi:MAG: 50S ribosomal protein L34 [Planctomycetes bacterium]|nr:50S ribosomal protein L34 [Planctomycetota bacterium]
MPKGRKRKIRKSNAKRRKYGFRSRSQTAGGRAVIRRKRKKRGKFVSPA